MTWSKQSSQVGAALVTGFAPEGSPEPVIYIIET